MIKRTAQEIKESRSEEVIELTMAITGLQKLVERYIPKEDWSLISNLLAVTEELEDKKQALIALDASLLYHGR